MVKENVQCKHDMKTYDLARGIAAINNNYLSLESIVKGFTILYPNDKKLQGLYKLTQEELSLPKSKEGLERRWLEP